METPNNPAGAMTERIMLAIREHLIKQDVAIVVDEKGVRHDPQADTHHYNRAYEKVYALLSEIPVEVREEPVLIKPCGKLFARRGMASFKTCERLKGHQGICQ